MENELPEIREQSQLIIKGQCKINRLFNEFNKSSTYNTNIVDDFLKEVERQNDTME
mgnify:CR=1 FL=1